MGALLASAGGRVSTAVAGVSCLSPPVYDGWNVVYHFLLPSVPHALRDMCISKKSRLRLKNLRIREKVTNITRRGHS